MDVWVCVSSAPRDWGNSPLGSSAGHVGTLLIRGEMSSTNGIWK